MKEDDTAKPIKTVLWTTDFSKESRFGLPYVNFFSGALKTENHALYVLPKLSDWVCEAAFDSDEELLTVIERTRKRSLTKLVNTGKKTGIDFEVRVVEGTPSEEIIKYAAANKADLVIAGRRGVSEIEQILIGSTTSRLVRNSPVPVLIIPRNRRKVKIERILCPVDFSDFVLTELEYAVSLSRELDAVLYVVHVTEFANFKVPLFNWNKVIEKVDEKIAGIARQHGLEIDSKNIIHEIGEPAHKIIEVAQKYKADVITMATHQRKGIERFFLGSITEKVLTGSDIPLIILPPPR